MRNVYFGLAPDSFDFQTGVGIPEDRFILESGSPMIMPKAIVSLS